MQFCCTDKKKKKRNSVGQFVWVTHLYILQNMYLAASWNTTAKGIIHGCTPLSGGIIAQNIDVTKMDTNQKNALH